MNKQLHNKIMRRIYYAYAIQAALNPAIMHGFLMLAMLIILTYFVSIGNVIQNLSNVGFEHTGTFLLNAVTNTEAWTLLIIGGIIFSLFSLRFQLKAPVRNMHEATL